MPSTKQITCVVSGKQTIYSGEFLQKKIKEYGSVELLESKYICMTVRGYMKKGYKIADIRSILCIDDSVPLPPDDIIAELESNYTRKSLIKEPPTFNETLTTFTYNKSDSDVEQFINDYILK